MDGLTQHLRESADKASTQSRARFAVLELFRRKVGGARWYRALGLAGIYSLSRLALSFVTIIAWLSLGRLKDNHADLMYILKKE